MSRKGKAGLGLGVAALIGFGFLAVQLNLLFTPTKREHITAPIYTVGDAHYAASMKEGRGVLKFGPFPLLYPGGVAFRTPEEARRHLREIGKAEEGWGVYLLSGDFHLDTRTSGGRAFINKSLVVLERVPADEDDQSTSAR